MTVLRFPYRRPPLIECPVCERLMGDIQQSGVVLERFCATCKTVYADASPATDQSRPAS